METTKSQYTVASLRRYPVKSMAGEELDSVDVTARGLRGDRAFALVDKATNKVGSAKNAARFGELLKYRVRFLREPDENGIPAIRITMPDGTMIQSDRPETADVLASIFGPTVSLAAGAPDGLLMEIAAGTLGGKYSATTEVPISGGAPAGTLFNYASVHLVTRATLQQLDAADDRFRANVIVDTPGEKGFIENEWVGRTLLIGEELMLRVTIPCPRCVVTTLPRLDLPLDSGILRTIAERNKLSLGDFGELPCVGVYADVVRPGRIKRGDRVQVLNSI